MTLNSLNTKNTNGGVEWSRVGYSEVEWGRLDNQITLHISFMKKYCFVKALRIWVKLLNHFFAHITLPDYLISYVFVDRNHDVSLNCIETTLYFTS